jgi:purine catabolism regulator
MIDHFKLSVEEVLRRKCFQHAELLAGETGLHRMVKWAHIMEVTQIRKLLNGNELILSTGVGWKEEKEVFISFLEQLIESNASGLCIELGTYISTIPQEIIELANRHHFPLIVFNKEVRFLDITQDLQYHSF